MKLLLVEDSPIDRRVFAELVKNIDGLLIDYDYAETLAEALKKTSRKQYNVIVLDLGLPDSQGLETFYEVRKHCPEMPIIIMSGLQVEDIAKEALANGAHDYLIKGNFDATQLIKSIRFAILRQKSRSRIASNSPQKPLTLTKPKQSTPVKSTDVILQNNLSSEFIELYERLIIYLLDSKLKNDNHSLSLIRSLAQKAVDCGASPEHIYNLCKQQTKINPDSVLLSMIDTDIIAEMVTLIYEKISKRKILRTQLNVVCKVLLIEDNPIELDIIRRIFAKLTVTKYILEPVETLERALDRLKQKNDIDIILADLSLPDSNGAATFLNLNTRFPELSIIVLTNLLDDDLATKLSQIGAHDYINKIDLTESLLDARIKSALARKRENTLADADEIINQFMRTYKHDLPLFTDIPLLRSDFAVFSFFTEFYTSLLNSASKLAPADIVMQVKTSIESQADAISMMQVSPGDFADIHKHSLKILGASVINDDRFYKLSETVLQQVMSGVYNRYFNEYRFTQLPK